MKKTLLTLIMAASLFGAASSAQAGSLHISLNSYGPPPPQQYIVTDYWRGTGYWAPIAPRPVYVTHVPRHYKVKYHDRHRYNDWRRNPHRGW